MTTPLRSSFGLAVCLALALAAAARGDAQTPQPMVLADFNHDGIPDALVVSTTGPTATIAFGSVPYGTFNAAAKAVTFPAGCTGSLSGLNTYLKRGGTQPRDVPGYTPQPAGSLQVADFNGDGFPDLAFFCGDSAGTMLGNGDGTFATAATLSGVASFSGIVGDFNNDGKLDIVVLSTVAGANGVSQSIQFLAGNGDGTFQEPVLSNLTENAYATMVGADLNGDGYTDLVLINSPQGAQTMEVLGNNKNGTFGTLYQGFYSASVSETIGSEGNLSLLTGNFFGAATTDVVVASAAQNGQLFGFQNTSSGTQFSFNDPVTVPVANLSGAAAGKFTGSAFTDVAVANGTNIAVLADDGAGNFAASYPTLTLASTSSLFSVADANGDGYADLYTAILDDSGVLSVAASVTTGSATATSKPFSLGIGTQAVSAAWNGNVNLLASTATGQQIVNGAVTVTAVTSSKNPSTVGDSVTFTVSVAGYVPIDAVPTGTVVLNDGATMLASGTLDGNGVFSYTTAALTQATHAITAAYAGDNYFAASTSAVLSQGVNHAPAVAPNLTWATPAPIIQGTPLSATQLDAAATDATGAAIPGTFVYTPAAGTVLAAGTATLSVTFTPADPLSFLPATATVNLVVEPSVGATITAPPTITPGSQASITVTLTQSYPVDLTGTLTIGFTRAGTPQLTDPSLQFAAGGTTLSFTIPANTTTVPPILLQAGTIAGTITVPLTLTANGVNVTPADLAPATIVVPAAAPTVSGMTITRGGDQLTVVLHGFSNTREVVSAQFHFTAAPGAAIGTPDLTLPADTIFNADWFNTEESQAYGSTFTYTQIFNTSDGAANIGSVDATLTNSIGVSASITAK